MKTICDSLNEAKFAYAQSIEVLKSALPLLNSMTSLSVEIPLSQIIDEMAHYYFYNSSYDAYERYSCIESFKEVLYEEDALELMKKYADSVYDLSVQKPDSVIIRIPLMMQSEVRNVSGWTCHSLDENLLANIAKAITEYNPLWLNKVHSIGDIPDSDILFIISAYSDRHKKALNVIAQMKENILKLVVANKRFLEKKSDSTAIVACQEAFVKNNILARLDACVEVLNQSFQE